MKTDVMNNHAWFPILQIGENMSCLFPLDVMKLESYQTSCLFFNILVYLSSYGLNRGKRKATSEEIIYSLRFSIIRSSFAESNFLRI
jgi:hypothetical protein